MVRPKKCKLPPPPAPKPGPFKLFVKFPSDTEDAEDTRVHTITIESDSVAVTALKARIELLLGLPGKRLPLTHLCCHGNAPVRHHTLSSSSSSSVSKHAMNCCYCIPRRRSPRSPVSSWQTRLSIIAAEFLRRTQVSGSVTSVVGLSH